MKNKNVIQAKKEFVQFLKRHKAVATYFWTVYGYEINSRNVKETLAKIEYETQPKQLCQLYENLLGRIRMNSNIKVKYIIPCSQPLKVEQLLHKLLKIYRVGTSEWHLISEDKLEEKIIILNGELYRYK